MLDVISVLQVGDTDWREIYQMPEQVDFTYAPVFCDASNKLYDIVFVDKVLSDEEVKAMDKVTRSYTLFLTDKIKMTVSMLKYYKCRKGKRITQDKIQEFLLKEVRNYFPKPYGEKFSHNFISIAQGFKGSVKWDGNYSVTVQGDYGEEFNQIVLWRSNIPIFQGQAIEIWLEYEKDPEVEIELSVTQFTMGSLSDVQQKWLFTENDLQECVVLDNPYSHGVATFSLLAKGKGKLKVIALHDRHSRRGHGCFLPGGERYVTSNREEFFCYFDPGDMKPPLNVYFSGYKTRQGFEGYYLMRKMGSPFLLIADQRLEGGGFYMGSQEYETLLSDTIKKYMAELHFRSNQVIFCGLSMGTYGALYYGCDILPHAMLLGKPLASIGQVAANERLNRPGGFATSLDVLRFLFGDTDEEAVKNLNKKFWDKFDKADWKESKFVVSYMIEDDYDSDAYDTIISHLRSEGVHVYGKGIHGRHNDDTSAIVNWFVSQFERVLQEDFSRRIGK